MRGAVRLLCVVVASWSAGCDCGGSGDDDDARDAGPDDGGAPSPWEIVAGPSMRGVFAVSEDDVWAVAGTVAPGEVGTVSHFDGVEWREVRRSTASSMYAVWASGPTDVVAVGSVGRIERWDGTDWTEQERSGLATLRAVWGSGPDDVWAAGDEGTLRRWDGSGWSDVELGFGWNLHCVWGSGPSDVWVAGEHGALLHWNGATLDPLTTAEAPTYTALGGSGPEDAWLAGGAELQRWDGASWNAVAAPAAVASASALFFASSDDGWATGAGGALHHWDGATWTAVDTGTSNSLYAVHGPASGPRWAVGAYGTLLRLDAQEVTVVRPGGAVDADLNAMAADGDGFVAFGASGRAARWDGDRFSSIDVVDSSELFVDAWTDGAGELWAVGTVAVRREADAWVDVSPGIRLGAVWGSGPDDVWVGGEPGSDPGILHWDGAAWTTIDAQSPGSNGLWGVAPDDVWSLSGYLGLVHWDGASWLAFETPNVSPLLDVWGAAADDVWVSGDAGYPLHWDGLAWSMGDAPTVGFGGQDDAVWGTSATAVWMVGSAGRVTRYDGTAWSIEPTTTQLELRDVLGVGGELWAVGEAGLVMRRPLP